MAKATMLFVILIALIALGTYINFRRFREEGYHLFPGKWYEI